MKKKILMSLFTMAIVGALIGGGVMAVFTDTETSTGNTFSTGTMDIVVTVSGACSNAGKITVNEQGDGFNDNVVFANLAPGDSGNITWTVTNNGSLPGMVMIHRTMSNDSGELDDNMWLLSTCTIDNVSTFPNPPYGGWMSLEATYGPNQFDNLPKLLPAGSVLVVTYNWSIDSGVGNIIQGDTFTLNLEMTLSQIP